MHPFKIFVFASVVLIVAFVFRYERKKVKPELPKVFSVPLQIIVGSNSEIPITDYDGRDTANIYPTFFEDCIPDSCLANFIQQLSKTNDSLIRILYFGNSQLEGDFFTRPLRKAFQQYFGGSGIGYMPAEMYFNTTEKVAIITSDFEKHVVNAGVLGNAEYGLYGRFFTPTSSPAELRIKNKTEKHQYQLLKVLYSGEGNLSADDGTMIQNITLSSTGVDKKVIAFENTPTNLQLSLESVQQLKLYGILLDPVKGVVVDHVPFRGNLNLMLNCFGETSVKEMAEKLNPALVVLQYGLNVIPDVRPDYKNYRIAIQRDIQLLKRYVPNVSVIVVGAPDMAHKVNGEMLPYENIDQIIAAQKTAALNENVAFWNLRKAMGGNGSVIRWVDRGLARTDYAHLNAKGSEKMASTFSNDLFQVVERNLHSND